MFYLYTYARDEGDINRLFYPVDFEGAPSLWIIPTATVG